MMMMMMRRTTATTRGLVEHVRNLGGKFLENDVSLQNSIVNKNFIRSFGGFQDSDKTVKEIVNLSDQARKIGSWTIDGNATVFDATKKMIEKRTGSLCITENDKVVGLFTERDYLTKVLHEGRSSKTTLVKDISTHDNELIVASPDDNLQDCIDILVAKNIRHLPIAESDGTVIGLLDIQDICKVLADERTVSLHTLDQIRIASKMPIHDG